MSHLQVSFSLLSLIIYLSTISDGALGTSIKRSVNLKSRLSIHPKLVVLSFDGFRFDFPKKTETPNLDKIKSNGVYTDHMRPRFPTKTFPNHQSIATGLYPESHGIIANDKIYDPLLDKEVSPSDEQYWNFRDDIAPIWIHNEWAKDGRYSASNWPGANFPYGRNRTLPTYRYGHDSPTLEQRVDKIMDWLTDKEKPANLIMMYFNEPDKSAHSYGPESSQVISAIKKVDSATGYLLKRFKDSGIDDEINLITLSDHGFQEVSLKKVIKISSMFNHNDVHPPHISTPVTLLSPRRGKITSVYNSLKNASRGKNFNVYLKEDVSDSWHFAKNRRVYPIVIVADQGYVFDNEIRSPNYDENRKYGVHGYDNSASTMQAFFRATGPAFKKGFKIITFSNVDVFPLMCKIINLKTPRNNGTLTKIGTGLLGG